MMNGAFKRLLLVPLVTAAMSTLFHAQVKSQETQTKPSHLKLEIIPGKKAYRAGEAVIVRYELTNISDKTVCFPPPDTKSEEELKGYVRTSAMNSHGEEDFFIESFYTRRDVRTDQDLLEDANENWIKLAPGLSYVTDEVRPPLARLTVGALKLQSLYVQPYLGGKAKLIVDALSCTPPEVGTTSRPVKIRVTPDLQDQ